MRKCVLNETLLHVANLTAARQHMDYTLVSYDSKKITILSGVIYPNSVAPKTSNLYSVQSSCGGNLSFKLAYLSPRYWTTSSAALPHMKPNRGGCSSYYILSDTENFANQADRTHKVQDTDVGRRRMRSLAELEFLLIHRSQGRNRPYWLSTKARSAMICIQIIHTDLALVELWFDCMVHGRLLDVG
jgi:hypothetical protein